MRSKIVNCFPKTVNCLKNPLTTNAQILPTCILLRCDLKIKAMSPILIKVSKGAQIRNRYNQIPHLTQDTNGKVTNSQLDTKNESEGVSPFPAGDHK